MNDEYYYIKIKSFEYDKPDWFMVEGGFSPSPKGVRVFDDIDEAIDVKKMVQDDHKGYTVEIVRF